VTGGLDTTLPPRHNEQRNVIMSAHADGIVRIWDAGQNDEIENTSMCQADVARAVGRIDNVQIMQMGLASTSGELAIGLRSGELVVFRWARNNNPGRESSTSSANKPNALTNATARMDPGLIEGFQPFTVLDKQNGPCTALKVSNIGFVAAGFEGGSIVVVDLRGPAIIFDGALNDLLSAGGGKSPLSRRKSGSGASTAAYATTIEFSVMTLDGESYSSILLHVGTNTGSVVTLKILPGQGGRYSVSPAGSMAAVGKVKLIHPLNGFSTTPAHASPQAVASLRDGFKVDGFLLVVTENEARIFRPASAKGTHHAFSNVICLSAAVANYQGRGLALVGLFGDGTMKAYSIPGLREITTSRLEGMLDIKRFQDDIITTNGDIVGWTGPSEIATVSVWGMPSQK
jgi:syntaxin-binding protein 5